MSAIVFTDFERELFTRIGQCADTLNYPCFIMGGFVRDKLLRRATKDMDIMVVGSGVHFAETLKDKEFPNGHLSVYRNFGTALIKEEGLEIEFVGARKESYRSNSRKPIVEEGSMEDDLSRRDFTINAMGICLNQDRFGELVDLFDGQKDLQDQIIRTPLEPVLTFSDDPLRMLRAIRFATRLGFQIEENTWKGICESAERIKKELRMN